MGYLIKSVLSAGSLFAGIYAWKKMSGTKNKHAMSKGKRCVMRCIDKNMKNQKKVVSVGRHGWRNILQFGSKTAKSVKR